MIAEPMEETHLRAIEAVLSEDDPAWRWTPYHVACLVQEVRRLQAENRQLKEQGRV
jgi:hypothetical protein